MAQKPQPFSRPSIDLGAPPKEWQDIPPHKLRSGDIVVDHGQIKQVVTISTEKVVHVDFISGERVLFPKEIPIKVFAAKNG